MFGGDIINNKTNMEKQPGRPRARKDGEQWVRFSICLLPEQAEEFERLRGKIPRNQFVLILFEKWKEMRRAEIKEKLKARAS